jgi:hypothetical protein
MMWTKIRYNQTWVQWWVCKLTSSRQPEANGVSQHTRGCNRQRQPSYLTYDVPHMFCVVLAVLELNPA